MADPVAYTAEELREGFLEHIRNLVGYWERESRAPTPREKLEGLAFSMLNIFDGTTALPAFDIVAAPHPDDKQYHIDNDENWIEPGTIINDCMLHELFHKEAP
jgi:hypothetical protein